jgi:hypothetical protein
MKKDSQTATKDQFIGGKQVALKNGNRKFFQTLENKECQKSAKNPRKRKKVPERPLSQRAYWRIATFLTSEQLLAIELCLGR